jgi:hypothetical protein
MAIPHIERRAGDRAPQERLIERVLIDDLGARGVQADARTDGSPETLALLNRLLALPGVAALAERPPPSEMQAPVVPVLFRQGDAALSLFSTIATLGTPRT